MIRTIKFSGNYDEQKVKRVLGVLAKWNAVPQEIVISLPSLPNVEFTCNGLNAEQLIEQANKLEELMKG
jgi:2'-5' RNA ligase